MLKKLCLILVLVLTPILSYSGEVTPWYDSNETPIYVEAGLSALNLYVVGGSTTATADYANYGSSIEFITTGGLYPGTTNIVFAEARADTIYDLVNTLNGLPVTTPGAEGGIVAAYSPNTYLDNETSRIPAVSTTGCLGVANISTLTVVATNGISYILDRSKLDNHQQFHITDLSMNLTFTSGNGQLNVYDGVSSTNTKIRGEKWAVSGIDAKADIPPNGNFAGTFRNDYNGTGGTMRFDVICTTNVSAGNMNMTFYKALKQ
jgi:hypothetical protein